MMKNFGYCKDGHCVFIVDSFSIGIICTFSSLCCHDNVGFANHHFVCNHDIAGLIGYSLGMIGWRCIDCFDIRFDSHFADYYYN